MPKYSEAGVFTDQATLWWQEFLDNFESNYASTPQQTPPWTLDHLPAQIAGPQPPLQMPLKIAQMHDKETKQKSQVCLSTQL